MPRVPRFEKILAEFRPFALLRYFLLVFRTMDVFRAFNVLNVLRSSNWCALVIFQGYPLYDSNTDFRFFWVRTKLMEADGPLETVSASNAFRIKV